MENLSIPNQGCISILGAFPALSPLRGESAGNRAIRLYLFCLRQKRIPLLSLARTKNPLGFLVLLKNGLRAVFEL
jgi:hypothetical protein